MTDSRDRRLVVDLRATARQWSLPADDARAISQAAPAGWTVRFVSARTTSDGDGSDSPSAESLREIVAAEAYFGFGMSRTLFASAQRLRWIHSAAAGVASLLFREMADSEVALTNSAGIHAIPIAEHVIGGVIFLLRSFDVAIEQQRAATWSREAFVGDESTVRELGDCRAVIVGVGGIGGEIARRLSSFGTRCAGVRRRPALGTPSGFERIAGPDELDTLLSGCDILILAAPATPDTRALVTAERLDHLPSGALIVNVARGLLLDEEALASRIASGRLRGAVLDVFRDEPLPRHSALWGLPSVLLTPHVSATSPHGFWRRELELFLDNWTRYVAGRPLRNLVDKKAGY